MELDIEKVVDYLENHVGESATSYMLVKTAGAYEGDDLDKEDLFGLEEKIKIIAEKNGFTLNKAHHKDEILGMPWCIDFIIERRNEEEIAARIMKEPMMTYRLYRIQQEYGIFDRDDMLIGFKTNMPWELKKIYDEDNRYIEDNHRNGIMID